jgi:predicted small metal-binding protein
MHKFQCGSPVCHTKFTAPTKDLLMQEITRHIQDDHHIPHPTKPIVDFLVANTISEVPDAPAGPGR